ncbi:hypothetical protein [Aliikangiella sp. G2MR2-5]|uniref:hypothetical protein n=1 Tax=Aliikangiella sp. G2MR2-5 TaxID=2788943 RepID=UPI0018ABCB7E|nr:hypothetical protein [Aliikangiella sp. G2MR2-5]
MNYQITASPVFKLSLQRLCFFLEKKHSKKLADKTRQSIRSSIETKLTTSPLSVPISERLIELGITRYRQLMVDKHNLIFFAVDEENRTVMLLAVMDSRQSIQKLLYEVNLLL